MGGVGNLVETKALGNFYIERERRATTADWIASCKNCDRSLKRQGPNKIRRLYRLTGLLREGAVRPSWRLVRRAGEKEVIYTLHEVGDGWAEGGQIKAMSLTEVKVKKVFGRV